MAAIPETGARRMPPWRAKVERFGRWWWGELAGLTPALGATRLPLVALEGETVTLVEPKLLDGKPEAVSVDVAGLDPARASTAVRALLERAGESRGRARLALDSRHALVRRVTMPAATEENLGAVLGFEMDRLTPFKAEDVYHDYRVLGRDAAAGTIAVLLAVARRDVVDAHVARMRELGVSIQGVAVAEDARGSAPALDVLPSAQRGEREKPRERLAKQVLAGAALVLLLAALAIPVLRKRSEVHAMKPVFDKALAEAQATDKLIKELERQVADYNFLLAKKHERGSAIAYVEEISRLLPDNTWLQQLDVKNTGKARELQISGETVSASKLIEVLEQSQLLQNASQRGSVTRGTQPGTERFVIAAEAKARPQPETRAVNEVAAAVAPPPMAPATNIAPAAVPPAPAITAAPAGPAPPTAVLQVQPSGAAQPANPHSGLIFQPRGKVAPPPPEAPKPPPKQ